MHPAEDVHLVALDSLCAEKGSATVSQGSCCALVSDGQLRSELSIEATMATDAATAAKIVLGTANYLAPEVRRGGDATAASDIYALGVTLWAVRCSATTVNL